MARLGDFADAKKAEVTIGRTHYQVRSLGTVPESSLIQAASLTTIGKRACMWAQELLIAYEQVR